MEKLFAANITVNGESTPYEISFHDEQYSFHSLEGEGLDFSLYRERDEWHTGDKLDEHAKTEAIGTLEKYLLAQH